MIRFLADENVPRPSVQRLRNEGYDVAFVAEASPGLQDVDVLAWADREQRILLTFDSDFGTILHHHRMQFRHIAGVMYLRLRSRLPTAAAERILDVLRAQYIPIQGTYITIEDTGKPIRHHPLP